MIPVVAVTSHNFLLWLSTFLGFLGIILFFTLVRFKGTSIWGLLQKGLDSRAARIDAQLRMAEESQAAAAKARQEAEAEIAAARQEAAGITDRAHQIKGSLREELEAAAELEKQRIVGQAKDEIEAERNRAITQLRSQAGDVAVEAAREVLRQTIDERIDQEIIVRALAGNANGDGPAT